MSGNRSLDEFAGAEPDDSEPADEPPAATDEPAAEAGSDDGATTHESDQPSPAADANPPDADANPPDADAVDRPTSTYAWSPDGAPCDACGATVDERWRDDQGLVCADCKEW